VGKKRVITALEQAIARRQPRPGLIHHSDRGLQYACGDNPEFSLANADDRLSLGPFGRVEGGDCIVEGSHFADVRPQSAIPHPLDDLTQLRAIG